MGKLQYTRIATVTRAEADVIESFLEAEGIDVELIQESVARSSYSVTFQPVQVFVPKDLAPEARKLLKAFESEPEEAEEDEEEE